MRKLLISRCSNKLAPLVMKSWNKKWNRHKQTRRGDLIQQRNQLNNQYGIGFATAYAQALEVSKLGNCWERGTVFAYYASLDPTIGNSKLYRVEAINWDHVWVVMTLNTLTQGQTYNLDDLGTAGVILDGWTEDWWFPNVGDLDTIRQNCWRKCTPFALGIRTYIRRKYSNFRVQTEC